MPREGLYFISIIGFVYSLISIPSEFPVIIVSLVKLYFARLIFFWLSFRFRKAMLIVFNSSSDLRLGRVFFHCSVCVYWLIIYIYLSSSLMATWPYLSFHLSTVISIFFLWMGGAFFFYTTSYLRLRFRSFFSYSSIEDLIFGNPLYEVPYFSRWKSQGLQPTVRNEGKT